MTASTGPQPEGAHQDQPGHPGPHEHHHPRTRLHRVVFPLVMLFGRGAMARTAADLARLTPADLLVDVGCGTGAAVRQARRAGATRAIGIDPGSSMLRSARWITELQRARGVSFLEGTAENLPVASGSATVVWALQSVHHWEDRRRGFEEVRRVLAPAGRLLVMEGSVEPGVQGSAKHGVSDAQANAVVELMAEVGFEDAARQRVQVGKKNFTVITARMPSG